MADLVAARGIIHAGARWRPGNGANIKIRKDPWLPTLTTFKVHSPITMLHEDACVHKLIQEDCREWKTNLVQNVFWSEEAQTILSIPLSAQNIPDKFIWGLAANVTFLVKSAYRAALSVKKASTGEATNSVERTNHWKLIWSLTIPEKVQTFLWRIVLTLSPPTITCVRKML